MSKKHILILAIGAVALSGCSTLQKLNPFGHKVRTAPCGSVASAGPVTVKCDGKTINIDAPTIEELYQLRGPIDIRTGRSFGV